MSPVASLLEFYAEHGPSVGCRDHLLHPNGFYRLDGFLTMLIGNRTPYKARHAATNVELMAWQGHCARFATTARDGFDVRETLAWIRRPDWQWSEGTAPRRDALPRVP